MKDQILESVSEHNSTTNHTVLWYLLPPRFTQLLHCTFDFSFQQLVNLSGPDMGVLSLSRCWSFPLMAARWRVALFVEMCSAIQFHSSVSEESCRSIRREGPVIESQWSPSCVLFFFFFPFVYIFLLFMFAFVFSVFNITVALLLLWWSFWALHIVIYKIMYYKHNWHCTIPLFVPAFVDSGKLSQICPKNVFWSLPCFESKLFTWINNSITFVTAEIIILATWKSLNLHGKVHCYMLSK